MKRQGDKRRGHRLAYRRDGINGREGLNWLQTTAEAMFQSLIRRFLPPSLTPATARPQTFKKRLHLSPPHQSSRRSLNPILQTAGCPN